MTNELPLSHTSRQWLGLVAARPRYNRATVASAGYYTSLLIAPMPAPLRCTCAGLGCSGNCSPSPMPRIGAR